MKETTERIQSGNGPAASLGKRILAPVFAIALILFAGLVAISNYTSDHRALEFQKSEVRSIAYATKYAAQTVSDPPQFNRFVASLGGHPEIQSIHVIDDSQDTILASTDFVALGKSVSVFKTLTLSPVDRTTLDLSTGTFHQEDRFQTLTFSDQIDLSHWTPESLSTNYGRVIITLDRRIGNEQVSRFSKASTAAALVSVLLLLASILALIKKHVIGPLQSIERELDSSLNSGRPFKKPKLANDEMGHLAAHLEDTFATIAGQNQKATKLTNDLRFQKKTLDLHAIVTETDANGSITYVNNAFSELSGYTSDELIGKNHRVLNSRFHPKEFWKNMYRELAKKGVWRGEVRNKAKDGSFYWVNTTVAAYKNAEGEVERFVSIRTDITALKDAEFTLQKANAEIEQSLELAKEAKEHAESAAKAKTQFLATMSHEIRTPMNGLIGVLHLIEEDLPKEKEDLFQTAKDSADDLLVLINDILDFSKIDAGKMELESIQFNGLELIESVCDLHASTAHDKKIKLTIECDPSIEYTITGDPVRLRQIISNLVGNALKFTEQGSVSISFELEEKSYRISVSDTGIGIQPEHHKALFDSFTQGSSNTTRKFGGTGLGLSICKKLVNLMEGEIWIESELGKGSKFIFEIPRNGPIIKQEINKDQPELRGGNVLLVEPDSLSKAFLERHLNQWGLQVFTWNGDTKELPEFRFVILPPHKPSDPESSWKSVKEQIRLEESYQLIALKEAGTDAPEINLTEPFQTLGMPIHRNKLLAALNLQTSSKVAHQPQENKIDNLSELKVLIVDDNFTNRLIVTKIIKQRHKIDADSATGGAEAIEMIKSKRYDIVFMDCMMPEMDGYTATGMIRKGKAGEQNSDIPIVALTANAMSDDRRICQEAGMDDYIMKPVDPLEIARILQKWGHKTREARPPSTENVCEAANGESPVDFEKIAKTYRGNQEAIDEMLEIFEECMEENMDLLYQAANFQETEEDLRFYAHRIRGSAGEIGAYRLSGLSQTMEERCIENRHDEAAKLYPEISSAANEVRDAIIAYRSRS